MPKLDSNPQGQNYTVVATKVPKSIEKMLQQVADKNGQSLYELLQDTLAVIVRLMTEQGKLDDNLASAMRLFEDVLKNNKFTLADPAAKHQVLYGIYIVADKNKEGCELVMTDEPFMGAVDATLNIQVILDTIICHGYPSLYRRIKIIARDMGVNGILECLDKMLELQGGDPDEDAILEMFRDNNRSEYGRPIEYGQRYVRHNNRNIETINEQGQEIYTPNIFDALEDDGVEDEEGL